MSTVQGFFLTDVDVAALNNAGTDDKSHYENAVKTKKIIKHGRVYPYASGQAFRKWWRDALEHHFNWQMSPIIRENKIAYTDANPIIYPDDDLFGYMRAGKIETIDETTGKKKKENITLTRVSPLKNSALIAVAGTKTEQAFSVMSRQEGDPVPYAREEYSAIMKGMFSLDLNQAGTFFSEERTGFKNLNNDLVKCSLDHGAEIINDPFAMDKNKQPLSCYRLPRETRWQRIRDVISALKIINGGAMQTCNMVDITPKFLVLATFKTGNHPFSHLAVEEQSTRDYSVIAGLSIQSLKQVISDYKNEFEGKVFIGRRHGFFDAYDGALFELSDNNKDTMFYGSISDAIEAYQTQLKDQIP